MSNDEQIAAYPQDSAMGNPSPARVEALLGDPTEFEPDWKNEQAVDAWLAPRLEALRRAAGL